MLKDKSIADSVASAIAPHREGTNQDKTRRDLTTLNVKLDKLLMAADADESDTLGRDALRAMLLDDNPDDPGHTWLESVCIAALQRAASGDVKAMTLVFDRAFGRPHDSAKNTQNVQQVALLVSQLVPAVRTVSTESPSTNVIVPTLDDRPKVPVLPSTSTTDGPPGLHEPHLHTPRAASPKNQPDPNIIDAEFTDSKRDSL